MVRNKRRISWHELSGFYWRARQAIEARRGLRPRVLQPGEQLTWLLERQRKFDLAVHNDLYRRLKRAGVYVEGLE